MEKKLYPGGAQIRVLAGPFQGMKYFNRLVWGPIAPKWLGCYEEELHPVITEIVERRHYASIVDVGCAEGYYAVGLALRLPAVAVYAHDVDRFARRLTEELARLNGVNGKNLSVRGYFDPPAAETLLRDGCLVITDIEGGELEFFNDSNLSCFRRCDLLVEVHKRLDMSLEALREILVARFSATHEITPFPGTRRDPAIIAARAGLELTPEEVLEASEEWRGYQPLWLWMKAKNPVV